MAGTVGGDRKDEIVATEVEPLGELDGGQDVAPAREAERPKGGDHFGRHAAARQVAPARVGVGEHVQRVGGTVRDGDHDIGRHHVVDQGHVLVADALDVVLAEPVVQQGRALQRFDGDGERPEPVLQVVPAPIVPADPVAETNARTLSSGCEDERCSTIRSSARTGRQAVDDVVTEFAELVQDDIVRVLRRARGNGRRSP